MVAVSNAPLFNNDFPLAYDASLNDAAAHDAVAIAAIGAAAGETATATRTRIKASGGNNDIPHARATLETYTVINRATTATDVANLKAEVTKRPLGTLAFPRDLSGNGGPAFTRT